MNKFVYLVIQEDCALAYGVIFADHGDDCKNKLDTMFPKKRSMDFFGYTGAEKVQELRLPETPDEAYERGQGDARDAERWHEERGNIHNN